MIQADSLILLPSDRPILDEISFRTQEGCVAAVLGNNGAGKSTLLSCLNRIIHPQNGAVYVDNRDIMGMKGREVAKHIAYVAQQSETSRFTVFDAILMGRKPYIKFSPVQEDYDIVQNIIRQMGLKGMALRYIDELSGGELQKVMLARALAQQPKVLLLDEPTSNLDLKNQHEMLRIIRNIALTEKISVIIVIHDLNLALRYCDKFLLLKDSSIFAHGGREVMTPRNIKEVFGIPVAIQKVNEVSIVVPYPQ